MYYCLLYSTYLPFNKLHICSEIVCYMLQICLIFFSLPRQPIMPTCPTLNLSSPSWLSLYPPHIHIYIIFNFVDSEISICPFYHLRPHCDNDKSNCDSKCQLLARMCQSKFIVLEYLLKLQSSTILCSDSPGVSNSMLSILMVALSSKVSSKSGEILLVIC